MFAAVTQQFQSPENKISRIILGVLVTLWVIGMLFGTYAEQLFALTPGLTLSNYYLWTFITAGFFDNSFTMGLINIMVYVAVAPSLERSFGSYTFLKFIGVTNLCVMVSIFFSMVACYAATEYEPCLFRGVCGFSGINAAFGVALKQRMGERPCIPGVKFLEIVKLKHIPMVVGWASLLLWMFGSLGGKEAPLVFFGTFFSFLYLRFFMRDDTTGVVGDLRPEFSSATFFPDLFGIRPIVEFAGTIVFQTLYRFGLFQEAVKSNQSLPTSSEMTSLQHGNTAHSSNGSANASMSPDPYRTVDPTAERRRLLAIKAIDDKLAELARQPTTNVLANYPMELNNTSHLASNPSIASPASSLPSVALPSDEELATMEAALEGSNGGSKH